MEPSNSNSSPSGVEQLSTQAPEFGPQMPLSEKLLAIAIRAQNFTGASGVAVAIQEGDAVVCRASWGTSAPDVGVRLQGENSFTAQCMRAGKPMRCDNAADDPRVDAAACADLGVSSIAAAPISTGGDVMGVIAAFSESVNAFTDTHIVILGTLGEVVAKFLKDEPKNAAKKDEHAAAELPATPPAPMASPRAAEDSVLPVLDEEEPTGPAHADAPGFELPFTLEMPVLETEPTVLRPPVSDRASFLPPSPRTPSPANSPTTSDVLSMAVEKETEIRADELQIVAEVKRDPGLVTAADHITPTVSPASKPAAAVPKPAPLATVPLISKPVVMAKPKPAPPAAKKLTSSPDFSFSTAVEENIFRNKKYIIPAAAAAVLLISLTVWSFHGRHSKSVVPPVAAQSEQSAEATQPPVTTQPADLPPPEPVKVMNAAIKAPASEHATAPSKPPASEHATAPSKPSAEPVVVSDKPVRRPSAMPAVNPTPEAAPSVALSSSALPPDLPALRTAAPSSAAAASAKASQFTPNELVTRVSPTFPETAKRYRMQGKVVLSARILKDGRVGEVRVMSGPPVFQQSAVDAVKQWRYKPAHLDGEPVESTAEITLNFSTPR